MDLTTLRQEINRVPFQPLCLRVSDGRIVLVHHRDFVAVARPHNVIVTREDGGYEVLDASPIVSVDRSHSPRDGRPKRRKGR